MGGLGLSPAFPVGRVLKNESPWAYSRGLRDVLSWVPGGWTRMFSIGKMKQKFIDATTHVKRFMISFGWDATGADCEAIFFKTIQLAERLVTRIVIWDHKDSRPVSLPMEWSWIERITFYCSGSILSSWARDDFCCRTQNCFSGRRFGGLENTVVVTEKGYKILTPVSQEIFQVWRCQPLMFFK